MKKQILLSNYFPDISKNGNLPIPLQYTQIYTLYLMDKEGNFILQESIAPRAIIQIYDNLECDLNVAPNKPISKIIS